MEVELKRKDGSPYNALLSMRPIDIEGQPLWHAMIQDISDRKEAEKALRASEERDDLKGTVFANTIRTGEFPAHHENEIVTKTGERKLIAWNNTAIFSEKGEILGVTSIGEDITDRRKAQEALQESEKNYRELVENINDIIFETDENGVFTYLSPLIERLGYEPDDFIGKHFSEIVFPGDLDLVVGLCGLKILLRFVESHGF